MSSKNKFKINPKGRAFLLYKAELLDSGTPLKGWKQFKSTYRDMSAYYNTRLGIVLKNPKFILERRTPLKFRVPTINLGDGWVVQPIVRKTELSEALKSLKKDLKPYLKRGLFPDIHRGNVGWYEGKPVMFDW
jgi:hypothetical protein